MHTQPINSGILALAFIVQKRIIRSIMNANPKTSCRGFFKRLNILPFYSQHIFSLLLLVVKKYAFMCD
jgi:hypothetical protein